MRRGPTYALHSEEVELRFGEATLMDFTSVETLHKIALNYQNAGAGRGLVGC